MDGLMDNSLDIGGQQPFLCKLYTQISLIYPVPDPSAQASITSTLSKGLARLAESFPWVAGQTLPDDSGIHKIVPLDQTPRLVVKDLSEDDTFPSMEELRQAKFPFSVLDENVIAPANTIPGTRAEDDDPVPRIFAVQANFIKGGLILTFNGQHNAMDMTGQFEVMSLLSKACRGEDFTAEDLSTGNPSRSKTVQLLDDTSDLEAELENQIIKPAGTAPPPPVEKCTWAYFTFSAAALRDLKAEASKGLPPSGFVSTDDALCALIWRCTTRAKTHRLLEDPASSSSTVRFARAVDVRQFLGVSPRYPGLLQTMTYHDFGLRELVDDLSLGHIAADFRSKLRPAALAHNARAVATFLSTADQDKKSSLSMTARIDPRSDVALSSWSKTDCYALDLGLGLGRPEAVRRPRFVPVEGLMYLMPRGPDGEIALGLCVRDDEVGRLRGDGEWARYAAYVG